MVECVLIQLSFQARFFATELFYVFLFSRRKEAAAPLKRSLSMISQASQGASDDGSIASSDEEPPSPPPPSPPARDSPTAIGDYRLLPAVKSLATIGDAKKVKIYAFWWYFYPFLVEYYYVLVEFHAFFVMVVVKNTL